MPLSTLFLAKLIGLYLVIVVPAIFLNRKSLNKITKNLEDNPALVAVSGFFNLVLGLLVILFHNYWVKDWPVIITFIGWLGLTKGLIRLYFPNQFLVMAQKFGSEKTLFVSCFLLFAAGAYLIIKGFGLY